jgi:hypothetical protein
MEMFPPVYDRTPGREKMIEGKAKRNKKGKEEQKEVGSCCWWTVESFRNNAAWEILRD